MHAPPPPRPVLSPTQRQAAAGPLDPLRPDLPTWPSRCCGSAGVRVNPRNNALHGAAYSTGLSLRKLSERRRRQRSHCPRARASADLRWNAAGTLVAFTNTTATAVELWVLDAATGTGPTDARA